MNKFRVGDRVIVAPEKVCCHGTPSWNSKMSKWCGKTVTIDGTRDCVPRYLIKEDHGECLGQEHDGWRWAEVCFSGLAQSPRIVITAEGSTTTARLYSGKKVAKTAQAKCAPDDEFHFSEGARLALNRLLYGTDYAPPEVALKKKNVEKKPEPVKLYCVKESDGWLTKGQVYEFDGRQLNYDNGHKCWRFSNYEAWKKGDPHLASCLIPLVNRPAKVGEWVYINRPYDWQTNQYNVQAGAIYRSHEDAGSTDVRLEVNGRKSSVCVNDSNYLVLDGYKPEEKEYLNMKVVCVEDPTNLYHTIGKVYEVRDGIINDDSGKFDYNKSNPVTTLEELNRHFIPKFIEFKGKKNE